MGLCGSRYTPDELKAAKWSRDVDSKNIADLAAVRSIKKRYVGVGLRGKFTVYIGFALLYCFVTDCAIDGRKDTSPSQHH